MPGGDNKQLLQINVMEPAKGVGPPAAVGIGETLIGCIADFILTVLLEVLLHCRTTCPLLLVIQEQLLVACKKVLAAQPALLKETRSVGGVGGGCVG